ncbi:hypothetical protein F5X68DRAFT_173177 [Plectosphaerella plurivora]|uniref:C6 finger domain-containing protein n=1 Tax=Plectosphaerella plurivora TaxID=936078 RepID=A0A9P9A8V3_9PEZI|nr:hypothetical protein F5X68DRAFT_173177 [Plectosphaerella plurivora]
MNNLNFDPTSGGNAFWDLANNEQQRERLQAQFAFMSQQQQQHSHQAQQQQQQHHHHQHQHMASTLASTSGHSSPQSVSAMPAQQQRMWSMPLDMSSNALHHASPEHVSTSPAQSASPLSQHSPFQQPVNLLTDFALQQHLQQHQQAANDFSNFVSDPYMPVTYDGFASTFAPINPMTYLSATTQAMPTNFLQATAFNTMPDGIEDTMATMNLPTLHSGMEPDIWHDVHSTMPQMALAHPVGSSSPTGTFLEVLSLASSNEGGWMMVGDQANTGNFDFRPQQNAAVFNPGETLHLRTNSDSSDGANSFEIGSYEEIPAFPISPFSPESDSYPEQVSHRGCYGENHSHSHSHSHSHDAISPTAIVTPVAIRATGPRPSSGSGSGATSPPVASRRNSGPRKSPITKTAKPVIRRTSNGKKDGTTEKKVGRRRGPLSTDQRRQASEIRKLRACLRCKFLKKTCDKGEPCAGCQPSHARLWQVPCTRIDIKDIGYFLKGWNVDFERHMSLNVSVLNVKGFSSTETLMWITHGYGFALPVYVREVYVKDESVFAVDWVESHLTDQDPIEFDIRTEKLDVGSKGISNEALHTYLEKHIDGPFEEFIDDHFEGTPFITEILKTAHRFYVKEQMPVIRKALKLVLAYNLTMHITMVQNQGDETSLDGQIDDEDSKFYGQTVAPVMVNFQIKCALAEMWRELQKDILAELSSLYSSVYSGERLKNWPTIFMLASILLAVWEEMQFDSHYRMPDPASVNKFCQDMETTPVGVIVGLFHAISQKLPAFTDWDTVKHGHILNNNVAVCEAMTEVREHVIKHEDYLRTRPESTFDRDDFDSLSNKFLSKLVIRAN